MPRPVHSYKIEYMSLTKIVATVGPAVESKEALFSLVEAGASIFRLNLKHNNPQWHSQMIKKLQEIAKEIEKPLAILLDLPDPNLKNLVGLSLAAKYDCDFLALSLLKSRKEIEKLRKRVKSLSLSAKIIAKIETKESLKNLEEIIDSADGLMIARGDLGKEIPLEEVPYYQKKIIKSCVEKGKPVIVATEMLESMISKPLPTRAEVSDVANSVLDYTDAVMLSAETAIGKNPKEAVLMAEKICRFWEKNRPPIRDFNFEINHQTAAVCYSAYQLWLSPFCQKEKIKAFLIFTKGGMTAHMLSRLRPNIPILAYTPDKKLRDRLCLLYGILPIFLKEKGYFYRKRSAKDIGKILFQIKKEGYVKKGDKVIFIYAEDWGKLGKTNIVRIQEIP